MADIAELGFKLDTRDLERGQQALKNTTEAAKKAEEAAGRFTDAQGRLREANGQFVKGANEATGALAQATNALKGFAVVAAGLTALKMSSDVLREFSREVAALGAISEATGQQMEQMRQQAIALGGSTVYSAGEAAKAQKNLAAAGLSVNEVLKTTPIALQLAQAGAIDLAQASDLLANTMAQTGGTIIDMSRYADVFVKTANLATTDVNLLGSSMKYAAPIATALGISIEQTSAALGVMAQNGLKGEQGGTSLRSALMKMTDVTKESSKVLASYNIKVSDLDIQSRGLVPVLETLQKAHFNAADAAKVFGTEAFAGARALYSNIDTLKTWTGELESANGTAKRVAGTMSDNLDGAFKNVKSAVESLIITLSDSTGFEMWAKDALNALAGLGGSFSGVNEELVKSGDMSREAADGFDNMRLAIESVAAAALGVGVGMGLAAIPTVVTGITAALEGATAGAWAFNAALMANPISAVIGALVAAGAALYVFRDKELELGGVTAKVGDWIVGAWETARRIVAASVSSMVASVDTLGKAFVGIATGNFNAASAAVSEWSEQTKKSFSAVGGVTQNTQRIVSAASQAQNASLMRSTEAAIAAKNAEIKASDEKKNKIKADFDAQMAASKAAAALYEEQNKKKKKEKHGKSEEEKEAEALERAAGISARYTKDLELLHKSYSAGKISLEAYRGAVEKLIYSETEQGKAAKKLAEERQKEIEKISETADKLAKEAEVYGMSSVELARYDLAKTQVLLTHARETGAIDAVVESLEKELLARQNVLDEAQKFEQRKISVDAAKAAASAWENTSKDIERALTDSLMRSFDSGKSFGDSLVDYVKNAFKTAAIKVILSPVMGAINAIGAPLYGAVSGAFGGQSATGGASDISMLSSLSNAFSSTSMGQGIGNLAASGLNYLGGGTSGIVNSTLADIATNAPLTSNLALSGVGLAGSLGGGMLAGSLFGNKGYASTGGSMGGGLASTLALSAGLGPMGIIGAGLAGSLVGGGLGSLFGDSGPDMRTSTFAKQFGEKLNADLSEVFKNNKWFSGSEMNATLSAFNKQIEAMDSTLQSTLHLTTAQQMAADEALQAVSAKVYQFGEQWTEWTQSGAQLAILKDRYAAVLDATESGWGDFVSSFSGDANGFQTYLAAVVSALQMFKNGASGLQEVFGQQIASIKEFEAVAQSGETSAQAFSRLYSVFQLTNEVLKSLGHTTDGVNLSTTALREQFIALAGGADKLSGYVLAYYDGFYTEAERNARTIKDLQAEFAKYGATLPATRAEWRKLMESLDLSTESGQKAAVKMYELQGAFLSAVPATEDVTKAAKETSSAIAELEKYFKDAFGVIDYSGLSEQGRTAATALDELTAKLKELADAGGEVTLGGAVLKKYLSTDIPKLFASATEKFGASAAGTQTGLGSGVSGLLSDVQNAAKAIAEISSAQSSAITTVSEVTRTVAKEVTPKLGQWSQIIKSTDFTAAQDPANAIAQALTGRDVTATEREMLNQMYKQGIDSGKTVNEILAQIIDTATASEEVQKYLSTKTQTQYEYVKALDTEQAATLQAQAALSKAAATSKVLSGFLEQVNIKFNDAFKSVAADNANFGLSDTAKAAKDATSVMNERLLSIVETINETAKGIAESGGADVTSKTSALLESYKSGVLKTSDALQFAIESAFSGAGAESLLKSAKDAVAATLTAYNQQLWSVTKQNLVDVTGSIDKIKGFQSSVSDSIFALKSQSMSEADILAVYTQKQDEIKKQLETAMLGDNLDEQISLAGQLQTAIATRYKYEQDAQAKLTVFAQGLGDYLDKLKTSDLSTSSLFERMTEAQKQFDANLAASRGTGADAEAARAKLTQSSDTLLGLAKQYFASGEGYTQIYDSVTGGLGDLQISAQTDAERQLSAINALGDSAQRQISELEKLRGTFDGKLTGLQQQQAVYISTMQDLAAQLGMSQSAILQALKDMSSGVAAKVAKVDTGYVASFAQSSGIPVTVNHLQSTYANIVASEGQARADQFAAAWAQDMGVSVDTMMATVNGSHKDGLGYVPFDGYIAQLHKGERVLTADENRSYGTGAQDWPKYGNEQNNALLQEIKALRNEVAMLRSQQAQEHSNDLQQREAIAMQSAQLAQQQTRSIERATLLNS